MKKEILNQLKSDYEKLEIKPSAGLWSKIDQMDFSEDKVIDTSSKIYFQWWKYAAVIAFLVSLGGGLLYFNLNEIKNISQDKLTSSNQSTENSKINSSLKIMDSDFEQSENNKVKVFHSQQDFVHENQNKSVEDKFANNSTIANNEISSAKEEFPSIEDKIVVTEIQNPVITEKKKVNYIKADELLLGREFDKTRKENLEEHGKFGVLDMSKIKGPRLTSFKVLGMTIFSDSIDTK
ncbi:hypothetical protein ASG22_13485 [Chryseobacterium sp. Leaf405]|uniref:hypothetical protein n=1 Tax=Chryseobacterium sp. Leaf405 TaxID=1736367 RepID=UPI0006FF5A7B|nr:hypothetical protein [Chryseobacterium sp. Leaf405]KQT23380.1 hypothetical protein ASG22_13485 [Chryseobacterium sp. Leaf405]